MQKPVTFLLAALFGCTFHLTSRAQCPTTSAPTMDCLIGINARAKDGVDSRLAKFAYVREFHDWSLDVGYDDNTTPNCPDNLYRWNPGYDNLSPSFDGFYQTFAAKVSPTLKGLAPEMRGIADYNSTTTTPCFSKGNAVVLEQKPVCTGYPANCRPPAAQPVLFSDHAKWMTLFAARYGGQPSTTYQTFLQNHTATGQPAAGIGTWGKVQYFENNNEPDKSWYEAPDVTAQDFIDGNTNWHFSPQQYGAMLSADYDGHNGTLTNGAGGVSLGIKKAKSTNKVVMAGVADFRIGYIHDVVKWCHDNRSAATVKGDPFDVINLHHYSSNRTCYSNPDIGLDCTDANDQWNYLFNTYTNTPLGLIGVSPEEDNFFPNIASVTGGLKGKLDATLNKLSDFSYGNTTPTYGIKLRNKETWYSEFGYDSHPLSQQGAIPDMILQLPVAQTFDDVPKSNGAGGVAYVDGVALNGVNLRQALLPYPSDPQYLSAVVNDGLLRKVWNQLDPLNRAALKRIVDQAQADWIARSYLAISAARNSANNDYINKAMAFCITEDRGRADLLDAAGVASTYEGDYLYRSSGLLRTPAEGNAAKKSWYWVQTLRNVLNGYTYDPSNIPATVQNPTGTAPRIYRYKNAADAYIYVIWSPTAKGDGAQYTFNLDFPDLPQSFSQATIITMIDGDENGLKKLVTDPSIGASINVTNQTIVNLPYSETPVFIKIGVAETDPIPACPTGFTATTISCDAVRLKWSAAQSAAFTSYQIYYASKASMPDAADFDLSDPRIITYDDQMSGSLNNAVIAGLKTCEEYWFFLRGVTADGKVSAFCPLSRSTNECSCKIPRAQFTMEVLHPVSPAGAMVNNSYTFQAIQEMFDYGFTLNLCDFTWNGAPPTDGWTEFGYCTPPMGGNSCSVQDEFIVTFNNTTLLDVIYVYELTGTSKMTILYDDDATGTNWQPLTVFQKRGYNQWNNLTHFNHLQPIKRLKFIKPDDQLNIGKMVFCGRKYANATAGEPNQTVSSVAQQWIASGTVKLEWPALTLVENDSTIGFAQNYLVSYSKTIDANGNLIKPSTMVVEASDSQQVISTVIIDDEIGEGFFYATVNACGCSLPDDPGGTGSRSSDDNDKTNSRPALKLQPNPAANLVHVSWNEAGYQQINVVDMTGKVRLNISARPKNELMTWNANLYKMESI